MNHGNGTRAGSPRQGDAGCQPAITLAAEEGASLSSGSLRLYASLTAHHSSLIVGCIDLYSYDPLNRRAAVGIMVATEHRRQGYALAMLQALEELYSTPSPLRGTPPDSGGEPGLPPHAPLSKGNCRVATEGWTECFPTSNLRPPTSPLHTLYADIAATNTASLALFRKAGYTECGHFRDWLAITPLRPAATTPGAGVDSEIPEDLTDFNSPPSQGGVPEGEGGTTYIDTIRMQLILR